MAHYATGYGFEEQLAEQFLHDEGHFARLYEQRMAFLKDGRKPAKIVAPRMRAFVLTTEIFGLPVEIEDGCGQPYVV